jgi:hypothetical protein
MEFPKSFPNRPSRPARETQKRRKAPICGGLPWWAHLGSNQGPPACEAGALPLSYAPGEGQCNHENRWYHEPCPVALSGELAVP